MPPVESQRAEAACLGSCSLGQLEKATQGWGWDGARESQGGASCLSFRRLVLPQCGRRRARCQDVGRPSGSKGSRSREAGEDSGAMLSSGLCHRGTMDLSLIDEFTVRKRLSTGLGPG